MLIQPWEIDTPWQTFSLFIRKGKHTLITPHNTSIATAHIYKLIKHKILGLFGKKSSQSVNAYIGKALEFYGKLKQIKDLSICFIRQIFLSVFTQRNLSNKWWGDRQLSSSYQSPCTRTFVHNDSLWSSSQQIHFPNLQYSHNFYEYPSSQ